MAQTLKIGYFEHWHRPPYIFADFLKEQGIEIEKIDYSKKDYLEKFDVAIIEQHGFNDYIENDEPYIQDWVKRGGIMVMMHQDYQRWVPQFLPHELGDTMLIHRYIQTINGYACAADPSFTEDPSLYMTYLMPWAEEPGRRLFSEPEMITPDEMLMWKIKVDSFNITHATDSQSATEVRTAAKSCFITVGESGWEVLGSFMDCAVRDGALVMRGNYGKGMYFLSQILFPEELTEESERCLSFWRKYVKNLVAYFTRFKNGESEQLPAQEPKTLPIKKNYKMSTHMHSLDWYGADSQPGTINAIMRYMGWDICTLAVKDTTPYKGKLDMKKYCDDKVLFLDGQEYHPFNYNDNYEHLHHNCYHMLAMGIDPDAYTPKYTCSFFSDEEVDAYLKEAIDHVHKAGGDICATHPQIVDYWKDYDYDAVDREPMRPLAGTNIERFWMDGGRKAIMNSVDLYGPRRALDNPATNFIYLKGEVPCRESVVKAVRAGHTIASCGFDECDVCIGEFVPGDELTVEEAKKSVLTISAKASRGPVTEIRVYSGTKVIAKIKEGGEDGSIETQVDLSDKQLDKFIRVEIVGDVQHRICNTTPFYLK